MSDRTLPGIHGPSRKNPPLWPWFALVGGLVLIAVLVSVTVGGGDRDYDSDTSYEAAAQCEAAVEKRLKAPSTAVFDSTATGGGTWKVVGSVDAENSFGATVRSSYECTVIIDNVEDTARVRIDSFE